MHRSPNFSHFLCSTLAKRSHETYSLDGCALFACQNENAWKVHVVQISGSLELFYVLPQTTQIF